MTFFIGGVNDLSWSASILFPFTIVTIRLTGRRGRRVLLRRRFFLLDGNFLGKKNLGGVLLRYNGEDEVGEHWLIKLDLAFRIPVFKVKIIKVWEHFLIIIINTNACILN